MLCAVYFLLYRNSAVYLRCIRCNYLYTTTRTLSISMLKSRRRKHIKGQIFNIIFTPSWDSAICSLWSKAKNVYFQQLYFRQLKWLVQSKPLVNQPVGKHLASSSQQRLHENLHQQPEESRSLTVTVLVRIFVFKVAIYITLPILTIVKISVLCKKWINHI